MAVLEKTLWADEPASVMWRWDAGESWDSGIQWDGTATVWYDEEDD